MCAASVRCYAAAVKCGTWLIDLDETRLPLRHSHHRYRVDGPNGPQTLTVPLEGRTNNMATPMRDVLISEHGDWRRLHWGALYSAYGRSPYFDYVADDLQRIIRGSQRYLHEFNAQMHQVIVDFMALPVTARVLDGATADGCRMTDLRGLIATKKPDTLPIANAPYYQMWSKPFLPGLSILDLMMNLGREGIITLMEMAKDFTI